MPSACAAIYARRGAAGRLASARIEARAYANFLFGWETRDKKESGKTDVVAPNAPFQASGPRLGPVSRLLGNSLLELLELALLPVSQGQGHLFGHFHAENASIDCSTTAFTIVCRVAQPAPWVSNPSRYPAVTREAALSRSARPPTLCSRQRRGSIRSGTRILCFAAARSAAPAILFRAKALFCSGAVALR